MAWLGLRMSRFSCIQTMDKTPSEQTPPTADPDVLTWAKRHEHEKKLHDAQMAQITTHPDTTDNEAAIAEQQAWARRRDHEKRLHDSAIDEISHPHP